MNIENKIKPEIASEQCSFVEGKVTSNALNMLRTIAERALEMQNELYCGKYRLSRFASSLSLVVPRKIL